MLSAGGIVIRVVTGVGVRSWCGGVVLVVLVVAAPGPVDSWRSWIVVFHSPLSEAYIVSRGGSALRRVRSL